MKAIEKLDEELRQLPCSTCGGSGEVIIGENQVTREMAIDAGDRSLEGSFHSSTYGKCPDCAGGFIELWPIQKDYLLQAFSRLLKELLEEYCEEGDIPTVRGRLSYFQITHYDRLIKFRDWLVAKVEGREG